MARSTCLAPSGKKSGDQVGGPVEQHGPADPEKTAPESHVPGLSLAPYVGVVPGGELAAAPVILDGVEAAPVDGPVLALLVEPPPRRGEHPLDPDGVLLAL